MNLRLLVAVLAVVLAAGACAVPQRRDTSIVTKSAVAQVSVASIMARYDAVRRRADDDLDPTLLAQIEGGALLDIDQSAYFVSVRVDQAGEHPVLRLAAPERVLSPRFAEYPLWFVVLARDRAGGNKRVAVFERADSVSPWLMTMAPATTPDAGLPEVAQDRTGAAVAVGPEDATGTGITPTAVLQRYAEALAPGQPSDFFAPDAFLTQTRRFQRTQQALPFATFQQSWSAAQPPQFALRLESGGVLVFGTLSRTDAYSVETDSYIDWDDDADTAAYLPGRVYDSAVLEYSHQMLILVPPEGQGKPRLIGQYGGVVDGQGS